MVRSTSTWLGASSFFLGVVIAIIGGGAPALSAGNGLRAHQTARRLHAVKDDAHAPVADEGRSLLSTRNPECTMPTADPCTLNTTAIGMVETGYATYYDDECAEKGFNGCFTDSIPSCRTCYLSTDIYMAATNTTARTRPDWGPCPCCVPTTLERGHVDLEVNIFDYSIFNISESACTDAPTTAPTIAPTAAPAPTSAPVIPPPSPTRAPAVETPAPTPGPIAVTPAPSVAPVASATTAPEAEEVIAPTAATPAPSATTRGGFDTESSPAPSPVAGSASETGLATPSPNVVGETPAPSEADANDDVVSEAAADGSDSSDDGLSVGVKVAIGVGVGLGVIILFAVGYGVVKASRGS